MRSLDLKERLRRVVENPFFDSIVAVLIVVSCVLILWEFLSPKHEAVLSLWNDLLTLVFIVELSLRWYVSEDKEEFWRTYIIDVIAVIPIFRWFRLGRLFRVLRLFRLLRLFRFFQILARRVSLFSWVFFKGYGEYVILAFVTFLLILTGTLLEYMYVYKGDLLTAFWYTIFSMIAGEPQPGIPDTTVGRLVYLFVAFSGMSLFAFFVGLVTALLSVAISRAINLLEVETLSNLKDHIVICGYTRLAPVIISQIQSSPRFSETPVVIITEQPNEAIELDEYDINISNVFLVKEDFTKISSLKKARIERASMCVILPDKGVRGNLSDQDRDARTILTALTIEKLKPDIYTCAVILDQKNVDQIGLSNVVDELLVVSDIEGYIISSALLSHGLVDILSDLLSLKTLNKFVSVPLPEEYRDDVFGNLYLTLKRTQNRIPIALVYNDGSKEINPPMDTPLKNVKEIVLIVSEKV